MKVSCRWMADHVDIDINEGATAKLAERLTFAGLEVEGIDRVGPLSGAVVGRVITAEPMPDSDHLSLCTVDVGGEVADIVCGAPNVVAGALVPVILPGGVLPGGLEIEKRKLRGHVSNGMICSKAEFELEEKSEGIWIFDEGLGLSVGDDVAALLEHDDYVFDIKVPSNRPDCASIYGIAREVAALLDLPLRPIETEIDETLPPTSERVRIEIEDPADTPRYAARLMEGVTIGEAPLRMQHRLIKVGMRPLSNVVDATNYVMLELGHPLHPFDADLVSEPIVIQRARAGEMFQTLDDVDRRLTPEVLMIADQQGGLALAGVMGGQRSEIRPETTRVLLEAATFFGYTIRKSSRSVGLRSEASQRFERGIDPDGVPLAAARATHLIQQLTGCRVHRGIADAYPVPSESRNLRLRPERASLLLGFNLDQQTCIDILTRLQIEAEADGDAVSVIVPASRPDLAREVDLIEEVGRVHGYDRLDSSSPRPTLIVGKRDRIERDKLAIRDALCGLGMIEVVSDGFDKCAWREALGLPETDLVTTVNPMTVGQSALRSSLLPTILEIVDHNLRQGVDGGMIYEIGRVFSRSEGECDSLAGAFFGRTGIPLRGKEMVSLPMARGILDGLFKALRLDGLRTASDNLPPYLHPGRGVRFLRGGDVLGHFGELAPAVLGQFALPTTVLLFELDVSGLAVNAEASVRYAPLPQFPASKRDLSVLAPQALPEETIRAAIGEAPEVESVLLYDLYRGEQTGGERVSLTYELCFRAADRTLTDADVDRAVEAIDKQLTTLDVHIRS